MLGLRVSGDVRVSLRASGDVRVWLCPSGEPLLKYVRDAFAQMENWRVVELQKGNLQANKGLLRFIPIFFSRPVVSEIRFGEKPVPNVRQLCTTSRRPVLNSNSLIRPQPPHRPPRLKISWKILCEFDSAESKPPAAAALSAAAAHCGTYLYICCTIFVGPQPRC